ncbi:beta-lactamase family protein [Candidatus Sumerlaeota bacterium]|nr:beta-lactamase family protein [Candidatus Sumerlaeota bacterium]
MGAQVHVALKGKAVWDFARGEARRGVPMASDTLMLWLSCSKPVAAVGIAQLAERGLLTFDDLVCQHIPEFAANGKEGVRIRHLLNHTAGFPHMATDLRPRPWDESIAEICAAPLEPDWAPGMRAGYHLSASWFMLGELIRRLDGRDYPLYVREAIFLPLGMYDCWIGMPREQYRRYGARIGRMHNRKEGELAPMRLDCEEGAECCRPGINGYGSMWELGRFYQMILNGGELEGRRVLERESVRALTARSREGMYDETFRHKLDWGLGFACDSNRYGLKTVPHSFGAHCSEQTVGHSGSQSSTGYCDPRHGLVVCAVLNGRPGMPKNNRRFRLLNNAIYEDLGLA